MKKKVVSLLAVMALSVSTLAGCGSAAANTDAETTADNTADTEATVETGAETTAADTDAEAVDASDLKVGFIFLHDENSTYDLNFLNAAKEACEEMGSSAMRQLVSLLMQAAILFLQIVSATRITSSRLLKNIRMYSSAMQPEQRLIPSSFPISTMHLHPSMMDVTLQVSLQA